MSRVFLQRLQLIVSFPLITINQIELIFDIAVENKHLK